MMRRLLALPLLALLAMPAGAVAQCVMCARTAAAQTDARIQVMMNGVIVLLIPPVLILTGFLYLAWRRRKA
jgi:hypothetical protein